MWHEIKSLVLALGLFLSGSLFAAVACEKAVSAMDQAIDAKGKECTAVIRLDYPTLEGRGFQFFCGTGHPVSEQVARDAIGRLGAGPLVGQAVSGEAPSDEFLFHLAPGDAPFVKGGGASAVSARTGMALFVGSIGMADEAGNILYPTLWWTPAFLGAGCPETRLEKSRGFDLATGQPLPPEAYQAALHAAEQTAVPVAESRWGTIHDAVVFRYAPIVSPSVDEARSEWIVLINSGPR